MTCGVRRPLAPGASHRIGDGWKGSSSGTVHATRGRQRTSTGTIAAVCAAAVPRRRRRTPALADCPVVATVASRLGAVPKRGASPLRDADGMPMAVRRWVCACQWNAGRKSTRWTNARRSTIRVWVGGEASGALRQCKARRPSAAGDSCSEREDCNRSGHRARTRIRGGIEHGTPIRPVLIRAGSRGGRALRSRPASARSQRRGRCPSTSPGTRLRQASGSPRRPTGRARPR